MAFSVLMLAITLTYLTGELQGAFVGIWFATLMLSGWQTVRAGAQPKLTSDQQQSEYKARLSTIQNNRKKRRRG